MTINNPYRDNEIMVEPLTYLALMLTQNQEQTSNAAGYLDGSGKCVKLKKKEIKAGYKSDCDTESKGDAATVAAVEEFIKNNPQVAEQNQTLKKEVDKAGGWKNFWNNFSTWSKTEQGAGILNTVGMLAGGLMGNQQTPEADLPKGYPTPQQSTGMNPIWWILIGIGGLALLGGLAFGIYKLSVKKSVQTA